MKAAQPIPEKNTSTRFRLSPSERSAVRAVVQKASPATASLIALFPAKHRDALFVLFSWLYQARAVTLDPDAKPAKTLKEFQQEFTQVWKGGKTRHLITLLIVRMAQDLEIQPELFSVFLASLHRDLKKTHYSNKEEFVKYLIGTAEVPGMMLSETLDLPTEWNPHFRHFMNWLRRIEILRNVGEDWRVRHKTYLLETKLEEFDLEREKLWDQRHTWPWRQFVEKEVDALLQEKAILQQEFSHLPKPVRGPFLITLELMSWLLLKLRRQSVLCWSIPAVSPSRVQLARLIAWWNWKLYGLPIAKKGWRKGKDVFFTTKRLVQSAQKSSAATKLQRSLHLPKLPRSQA